eukprot:evm.model.scf_1138.1 EVM.evm.TU.scf_1138.1   scf_1138:2884-4251(+)
MEDQMGVEGNKVLRRLETAQNNLKDIFLGRRFCDITLLVLGRKLDLHRNILWSIPYFKPFLEGEWSAAGSAEIHVDVDDALIDVQTFEDVIASMYCVPLRLTEGNVKAILATASFLQLEDLCSECADFCIRHLSFANVLEFAKFASLFCYIGGRRLFQACTEFLWIHATDIQAVLHKLPIEHLSELLRSDHLWVKSEYERLRLVMAVCQAKPDACRQPPALDGGFDSQIPASKAGADGERHQAALQDLLANHIHYSGFSIEELHLAYSQLHTLGMPEVVNALASGIKKAEILQTVVLQGIGTLGTSVVHVQEEQEWCRFGVELDAPEVLKWKAKCIFYGGRRWQPVVERSGVFMGVYVHSLPAAPHVGDHYEDPNDIFPARVTIICKDRKATFEHGFALGDTQGFEQYMHSDEVGKHTTCMGSLRITFLVKRVLHSPLLLHGNDGPQGCEDMAHA